MIRNVTCKTTPVSRAKGHSAVAGAAYRAGENLKARGVGPNGEDKWYRYSPKSLVVRESFILTPEGAPDYATDRSELWNRVEEMETRRNSRLGRDVTLGLAYELDHDEQRALVSEFAEREFVAKGFVVDIAIHNYGRTLPAIGVSEENAEHLREWAAADIPFLSREEAQGRSDPHVMELRNRDGAVTGYKLYQPHAHLRVTPRVCEEGEFVQNKQASWQLDKHETAMHWRYEWPKLQNAYLARSGHEVRVSSTSAEEDAFPKVPRMGTSEDKQLRAIEERRGTLPEEARASHDAAMEAQEIDREFREQHNATLRQAFTEAHSEPEGSPVAEEREQVRMAAWWRNMSQRFNDWRFDFKEKASEWRQHFANQEEKLRSLLGWHLKPDEAQDGQEHTPPEAQPQQPPPEPQEPER